MIVVGLLRVFFFEKGANYYFSSHGLLTKFSISIVVVLLSILPRRNLCRAQGLKKGQVPAVRDQKLRFIRLPFLHLPAFRIVTICQRQPPPPLTYTVSAVMNSQASEHMKSTNSPISSGSANRFIGTSSRKRCTSSGELLAAAWNGVLTGPGEIESARIPCVANSRATPIVMVTTAPFAAA